MIDPWQMFAVRFDRGASATFVFSPAMALVGDISPNTLSGGTLSVQTVPFRLGVAVGPFLFEILVIDGFAIPFLLGAPLAGLGAVLGAIYVDEPANARPGWALIRQWIK